MGDKVPSKDGDWNQEKKTPEEMKALIEAAEVAMKEEDFLLAVKCYNEALDAGQSEAASAIYCKRSSCYLHLRKYDSALKDAEKCLLLDDQCVDGHIHHADACFKLHDYESALESYKRGLDLCPNHPQIVQNLRFMQETIYAMHKQRESQYRAYNVLDMCSQDVYPGDLNLLQIERAMMQKVMTAPTLSVREPDQHEAKRIFLKSLKKKEQGDLPAALELCSEALDLDPYNSLYWGVRARLHFLMKRHKEAFQDIDLVPREQRSVADWRLGGQILRELDYMVNAEFWLRKASKTKDEESMILFQQVRCSRLYDSLTQGFPCHISFSRYGRSIVATQAVEAGETVFRDLPLVSAQTLESLDAPACAHCAKSLLEAAEYFGSDILKMSEGERKVVKQHWPEITKIDCPHCMRERYCSERCRETAWYEYHEVLCPATNRHADELYTFCEQGKENVDKLWESGCSPIMIARIWAMMLSEAKRLAASQGLKEPSKEHWAYAKVPFRRFIAYGIADYASYVPEMFSIMQRIFSDNVTGVKYLIDEKEFNGRFYQAACNSQSFSDPAAPFDQFMKSIRKGGVSLNTVGVMRYLKGAPADATFAGMFPVHACLNHSCDNNVECCNTEKDGVAGIMVRARKPIKPGDELCTTYVDTTKNRNYRRALLLRSFNFLCECPRCQFEGEDPTVCTQCQTEAEYGKKFATCSRCHSAWYCSTVCQKKAWKAGHKHICVPRKKGTDADN